MGGIYNTAYAAFGVRRKSSLTVFFTSELKLDNDCHFTAFLHSRSITRIRIILHVYTCMVNNSTDAIAKLTTSDHIITLSYALS